MNLFASEFNILSLQGAYQQAELGLRMTIERVKLPVDKVMCPVRLSMVNPLNEMSKER